MRHRKSHPGTDHLVAESEKLREELLRTAARVSCFTERLAQDARELLTESGDEEGNGNDRPDTGERPGPDPAAH